MLREILKKFKCRFFGHQLQYLHPEIRYNVRSGEGHEVFSYACTRCGIVAEYRLDE